MDFEPKARPTLHVWGCFSLMVVAAGCLVVSAVLVLVSGSLVAELSSQHQFIVLLGAGLVIALLPAWLFNTIFSWLRQRFEPKASFMSSWVHVTLFTNVCLLMTAVVIFPDWTSQALHHHGKWPFQKETAQIFQIKQEHPILELGQNFVERLTFFLEEEQKSATLAKNLFRIRKKASIEELFASKKGPKAAPLFEEKNAQPQGKNKPPSQRKGSEKPEVPIKKSHGIEEPSNPRMPWRRRTPRPSPLVQRSKIPPPTRTQKPIARAENPLFPRRKAIELSFKRYGSSLIVPITLKQKKLKILLDTGASFLTISKRIARRLQVLPPSNAPSLTLQTANGQIRAPVGLLPLMKLGSFSIPNVTFVLCDACADRNHKVIGLLGLNVLRRFLMTLDQDNGRVILHPLNKKNRSSDILPFLKYSQLKGRTQYRLLRRSFLLDGMIRNRAPLGLKNLNFRVAYLKGDKVLSYETFTMPLLRSGEKRRFSLRDQAPPRFQRYRIELTHGEWISNESSNR